MIDVNLKTFTIGYMDVNDKGYLTELLISVDAHSEAEALNIVYNMDNNDQIDYSKAKNTRRKYSGEEDQDFLQEFYCINQEYKYPCHKQGFIKHYESGISIDFVNLIDSLDTSELNKIKELVNETEHSI